MENSRPLLSICIPTYNRRKDLEESLGRIFSQLDSGNLLNDVELVISSNASNDGTDEVVEEYRKKFARLRYNKNLTNLGYDRNVEKVIYAASGDFIWTLSDNDFISPGAIAFLLGVIRENREVAWVCVDNGHIFQDGEDWRVFKNGNDWLAAMDLAGGQISQNIYNRQFLPKDISCYFDNQWIHFSLAREIALSKPQMIVKNIFGEGIEDKCHWADDGWALVTFSSLKKIISGLVALGYDKKNIWRIERNMSRSLPWVVASAKINGLKVKINNLKLILNNFYKFPFNVLLALIIFFCPAIIIKFVKVSLNHGKN